MSSMSDEARRSAIEAARRAGARAARAYRVNGTVPRPPGSLTEGSLLSRQVATAWHLGYDETNYDEETKT